MKIHYLCHYDDYNNNRNLLTIPSGVTKINYIKQALIDAGFKVVVVSAAETSSRCKKINKLDSVIVNDKETIIYPLTFGRNNYFLKCLSRFIITIQLLIYLLLKVKKNDKVLVYHSLSLINLVKLYRCLGGKVYFEVEEIYGAVEKANDSRIQSEINYLQNSEGYILVNDVIRSKCGFNSLSASCYGIYKPEIVNKVTDTEKVHIVYAGVIGSKESDAFLAVEVAKFLDAKYVIHVLGYGSDLNICLLQQMIEDSNKLHECRVIYEGCLLGKQYMEFLSKCQIGLCTRVLEDHFSDYTFPSKVCVYLANQLIPICTPIKCIKESKIKDAVYFSKDNFALSIADVIKNVDLNKAKGYKCLLEQLNFEFIKNLQNIFKN